MTENSWAYFWTFYTNDFPAGIGFGFYTPAHLAFLCGIAVLCALLCIACRRAAPRQQVVLGRVVTFTTLGLELAKQVVLLITLPGYPVGQLPLHLCGLATFIEAFHALRPTKTTGEILYSLCLPGALAALLFPDWTMFPIRNFYCLQSFAAHALQVCFPMMLLASGRLRPNWRQLWRPALFLAVVAPPLYFLNKTLGTDFFFLAWAPGGSPLELLQSWLGSSGYIAGFAGLVPVVWVILYAPWFIADRHKKSGRV